MQSSADRAAGAPADMSRSGPSRPERRRLLKLAAAGVCSAAGAAWAASSYPNKPLTWIVPFTAGGPTDSIARQVAERMSHELPAPIIIENLPGAGGTLAAARLARGNPDGYSFLVGHIGYMSAAPSLYRKLAYDPVTDFEPVFRLPDTPLVLMVRKDHPARNVAEMIAGAKQKPGGFFMATAGLGSVSHLVSALFVNAADIKVTMVPYKGSGPALLDVMAGQVDGAFDQANTAMPQILEKKVRPLAVTSRTRLPQLKDVPTLNETALPGFEAATWYGLYAPKGTPRSALEVVERAYLKAMKDRAFQDRLLAQAIQILPPEKYTSAALRQHTEAEVAHWRAVAAKTPLAID
jgi:tripartite-type tricarboxylate transporter receptor subunit TctC